MWTQKIGVGCLLKATLGVLNSKTSRKSFARSTKAQNFVVEKSEFCCIFSDIDHWINFSEASYEAMNGSCKRIVFPSLESSEKATYLLFFEAHKTSKKLF